MLTASPNMVAMIGVVVSMSVTAVAPVTPRKRIPTPMSTVTRGSPAATSERKVRMSTTATTRTPRPSLLPSTLITSCSPVPAASTVRLRDRSP